MRIRDRYSIADSDDDDDDDDELLATAQAMQAQHGVYGSGPDRASGHAKPSAELKQSLDGRGGANAVVIQQEDPSTGSTERLRKEIISAERNLVATTQSHEVTPLVTDAPAEPTNPGEANDMACTATPGHSVLSSMLSLSPGLVHRSHTTDMLALHKTVKPGHGYGPQPHTITRGLSYHGDLGSFDQSFDPTPFAGTIPRSNKPLSSTGRTPSVHESENVTWNEDFARHEPTRLFQNTGSTLVENESSQLRLFERAVRDGRSDTTANNETALDRQIGNPATTTDHGASKESSLIWTPLDAFCTQNLTQTQHDQMADCTESRSQDTQHSLRADTFATEDSQVVQVMDEQLERQPSPIVRVPLLSTTQALPQMKISKSVEMHKKRDRSAQELSPGLDTRSESSMPPAELYIPRPTKRRATQSVSHESSPPDAAEEHAKIRRNKTANPLLATSTGEEVDDNGPEIPTYQQSTEKHVDLEQSPENDSVATEHRSRSETHTDDVDDVGTTKIDVTANTVADDELTVFIKPAPKIKRDTERGEDKDGLGKSDRRQSPRVRRSHTTIFEDHVEFVGSRKNPTLTELQAKRKKAASRTTPRGSKSKRQHTILEDSEGEEEDELAGRSTVDDFKTIDVHSSRRVKASIDGASVVDILEVVDSSESKPGRKRRGRPRKERPPQVANDDDEKDDAAKVISNSNPNQPGRIRDRAAIELTETESDPSKAEDNVKPIVESIEAVTKVVAETAVGSPDKPQENSSPPTKVSGPTHHSPIKHSSPVPLRVGLSKRQRIPSLLRVMRPPASKNKR